VIAYDVLVMATGSAPFVPPVRASDQRGNLRLPNDRDLEAILAYAKSAGRAAVVGRRVTRLEAGAAVLDSGLETHVSRLHRV